MGKYRTKQELQTELFKKNMQILYLRNHLKQVRDKMDYLLKHPYCQSYIHEKEKIMVSQTEIIKLLRECSPNRLTTKEIKERLKANSQISNQLRQLRHYGLVNSKIEIITRNKTNKEGFVYWI